MCVLGAGGELLLDDATQGARRPEWLLHPRCMRGPPGPQRPLVSRQQVSPPSTCAGFSPSAASWLPEMNVNIRCTPFRLFQLSQLYPEDNLEKFIPCLAGPDSFYLERNHVDLEADLR